MTGAQRMVSRRGFLVAGFTAGGAVAASVLPGLPTAGRQTSDATPEALASPVATPVTVETRIEIEAIGLRFSPSTISIPARAPVRIVFTNRSRVYHDLTIPGLGRTRRIGPDETSEFVIQAEPGAYEFYCSIQSHHQAGMGGTITAR